MTSDLSKKSPISGENVLPQAAKLPRTSGLFKNMFFEKSSVPGSEAAWDKWLVQNNIVSEKKFCPRQRSCPGQIVGSPKEMFFEENQPQAAKLPAASGLFKKMC